MKPESNERLVAAYAKLGKAYKALEVRLRETEMKLHNAEAELASMYFGQMHEDDSFEDTLEVMDD